MPSRKEVTMSSILPELNEKLSKTSIEVPDLIPFAMQDELSAVTTMEDVVGLDIGDLERIRNHWAGQWRGIHEKMIAYKQCIEEKKARGQDIGRLAKHVRKLKNQVYKAKFICGIVAEIVHAKKGN